MKKLNVEGYREICFFCYNVWGKCTCSFPSSHDEEGNFVEVAGFDWEGMWITQPNVSACTRFFVNPFVYYGLAFDDWWAGRT